MYLKSAIIASTLFLVANAAALSSIGGAEETFDYLMLSQEWPYTFCTTIECRNTDKLEPLFNIHGLWPEHVSGSCQGTFNYSELKPIEDQLKQSWMDLTNPTGDPEKFWYREYEKHGRCATVEPRFATTFQYFSAALQLHDSVKLTDILAKNGIVPGPNPVKISRIQDALTSSLGHKPELSCVSKDGVSYLLEVRLCFEKDLSARNCSSSISNDIDGSLKYDRVVPQLLRAVDFLDGGSWMSHPLTAEVCSAGAEVIFPEQVAYF